WDRKLGRKQGRGCRHSEGPTPPPRPARKPWLSRQHVGSPRQLSAPHSSPVPPLSKHTPIADIRGCLLTLILCQPCRAGPDRRCLRCPPCPGNPGGENYKRHLHPWLNYCPAPGSPP